MADDADPPARLGAHSVAYLVGTGLQGLGVLLILPFATRVLGGAEFGRVATGLVIVQVVGTVAAVGLPQVILREHHRGEDGPRAARALAGAMVAGALTVGLAGTAVALTLSATGRADLGEWLPLVVAATALTVVVSGQTLMRARLRPGGFLSLAVASTVVAQIAGVVAAQTNPTARTYLAAYSSALVVVGAAAIALGRPLPPTAERERVRAGLRLAAPLLPQAVSMLGLLMGDVLVVSRLLGDAAAGDYQVALQLGNVPFVAAVALYNGWAPLVLSRGSDRWAWAGRTASGLTLVVGVAAAGLAALGPWLVVLLTGPDFDRASIVAALAVVCTVSVAYMVYQASSLAVLDAGRTGLLAWAATGALGLLVAGSAWLAPALEASGSGRGILGVAVAKAVAYAVLAAVTVFAARRVSPLRWPAGLWAAAAGLVGVLAVLAFVPAGGVGGVTRVVVAVALVGACLAVGPRVVGILRG